jgi:hypothetical protein
MLLFFLSAVGILGGVILAIIGIAQADAGQLERIIALAFFAMAAAGVVGLYAQRSHRKQLRDAHA